jgi:hypothetical protein
MELDWDPDGFAQIAIVRRPHFSTCPRQTLDIRREHTRSPGAGRQELINHSLDSSADDDVDIQLADVAIYSLNNLTVLQISLFS